MPLLGPDDAWYVACASRELRRGPIGREIRAQPVVLFRDDRGRAHALLDVCPHRGVPLSLGRVVEGTLECAYHGWRFDGAGSCRSVPGRVDRDPPGHRAAAYRTIEQQGYVWIGGAAGLEPAGPPYAFPEPGPGERRVRFATRLPGNVRDVAENALDVLHTSFLHGGLFRGGPRARIRAEVRRYGDRAEVSYVGEPRPSGLAARLLAIGDGEIVHVDRFRRPSITEVEYALGDRSRFAVATALTPVDARETALFTEVRFRTPFPGWLVDLVVRPVALVILRQDARMLRAQRERLEQLGERRGSTELDLLASEIRRLLEPDSTPGGELERERTVELTV